MSHPRWCDVTLRASAQHYQFMPPKGTVHGLLTNVSLAWAGGRFHFSDSPGGPLYRAALANSILISWENERQQNSFLDRKGSSDFLLLLKQGIYRLLPSLRQLLNSACNSAQIGSNVKLKFTFFECFFPFLFYQALGQTEKQLREKVNLKLSEIWSLYEMRPRRF